MEAPFFPRPRELISELPHTQHTHCEIAEKSGTQRKEKKETKEPFCLSLRRESSARESSTCSCFIFTPTIMTSQMEAGAEGGAEEDGGLARSKKKIAATTRVQHCRGLAGETRGAPQLLMPSHVVSWGGLIALLVVV